MRTEDYIKKSAASNTFTKEDFMEIAASGNLKGFEEWMQKELTHMVFVNLAEKVRFRKTVNDDGSVTYFACLDWLDVEEMVKDIEQEKGVKP